MKSDLITILGASILKKSIFSLLNHIGVNLVEGVENCAWLMEVTYLLATPI
jgi:hypothetical protein